MEKIREKVVVLKQAMAEYDTLTENIADARFKLEQLRRKPQLGQKVVRGPNGEPQVQTVVTAELLRRNIDRLEEERDLAVEVVSYLAGLDTDDIGEIRNELTKFFSAYNRVGSLQEQIIGLELGIERKALGLDEDEPLATTEKKLPRRLTTAESNLVEIANKFKVPEISSIELPSIDLEA